MKKLLLATLLSCLSFANPAKASVTSWVRSLSQSVIKATWDRQAALISIFRPRRPMGFHILSRRISFHFTGRAPAPTASSVLLAQGTEEMRFFRPMAVILRAIAAIQSTATSPSTSLMRVGPQASFLGRLVNSTIFTC